MVYFVYLLVSITILPFMVTSSQDNFIQTMVARFPKEIGFFIGSSLIFSVSMFLEKTQAVLFNNKWIAVFFVLCTLHFGWLFYKPAFNIYSQWQYSMPVNSIGPLITNLFGLMKTASYFISILLGILLIKTLFENLSKKDWVNISKFLCWVGFILSIYSMLQWFGIDQIFLSKNWHLNHSNSVVMKKDFMMTFLSHHVLSSNFIALTAPLCLMFKDMRYKIFFIVMAISIFMADSLTSFAALAISSFAYLLFTTQFRKLILICVLFIVLSMFLGQKHPYFFSTNSRGSLWKESITDTIKNVPWTGFGIGSFPKKYKIGKEVVLNAHNEFVEVFNEGGFLMLIIVCGYLITLSRRSIIAIFDQRNIMTICFFCGFLGLFVISNGSFPFRFAPLATLGILYIAGLESLIGEDINV